MGQGLTNYSESFMSLIADICGFISAKYWISAVTEINTLTKEMGHFFMESGPIKASDSDAYFIWKFVIILTFLCRMWCTPLMVLIYYSKILYIF